MTAHIIATETRWTSIAHQGRVEQYRTACSCGVDCSPWTSDVMAAGYASRHLHAVAVVAP